MGLDCDAPTKNLNQWKHPTVVFFLFDRSIPHTWSFFNLGFKPLYCTAFFSLWHILRTNQGVSNLDYKGLKMYAAQVGKNGRNIHSIWEEAMRYKIYDNILKIYATTQCQDEVRILSGRTQKLKVAIRCCKQLNEHNLMYIYHKQCERAQTAKFSVICRLRQELFAENPKNVQNKRN